MNIIQTNSATDIVICDELTKSTNIYKEFIFF